MTPLASIKLFSLSLVLLMAVTKGSAQDNYMTYHALVTDAEKSWSIENFEQAINQYDSAFAIVNYIFTKDILIVAQSAALTQRHDKCLQYLHMALKNGYSLNCLKTLKPLYKFITESDWDTLEQVAPVYARTYTASIDMTLNIEFSHRYRNEQDNKGFQRHKEHIYNDILKSNYSRILELIDEKHFLSERIIGLDNEHIAPNRKNHLSGLNSCSAGNSKMLVTILHAKNPIIDIGFGKMMRAVQNGYLHPRELKAIIDYSHIKPYDAKKATHYLFEDLDLHNLKLSISSSEEVVNIEKVNTNRMRVGLCDLETEKKKRTVGSKYNIAYRFDYK